MAQKPYKYNIEYIQKFYSHGSEAKVVEFKPIYKQTKPSRPKPEKNPVSTIYIDPVAFCGVMVAIVMLLVMVAGLIQFEITSQDYAVMEHHVQELREENILLNQWYRAYVDLETVETTALALGMIPIEEAQTISINVEVPQRQPEPSLVDDIVWFLSGLFE